MLIEGYSLCAKSMNWPTNIKTKIITGLEAEINIKENDSVKHSKKKKLQRLNSVCPEARI